MTQEGDQRHGGRHRPDAVGGAALPRRFGRSDVDAVMEVMSDDCVFESTQPPDGRRHQGQAAVRRCWQELFTTPGALFTTEELVPFGDRAVVQWRYSCDDGDGGGGHVRGVDLFTMRGSEVTEKQSYVKG